jgi:hypothetical protein
MRESPNKGMAHVVFILACHVLFAVPSYAAKPGSTPTDLSGVTQNWDQKLPNETRFTILADFNNQAVRDNETGLVWERSPNGTATWEDAIRTCWMRQVGGRMGWHLPTIEELASLVDPTIPAPGPALPPGNPFVGIQIGGLFESAYWSSTTDVRSAFLPTQAWEIRFFDGTFVPAGDSGKSGTRNVWCVRGGTHADKYK